MKLKFFSYAAVVSMAILTWSATGAAQTRKEKAPAKKSVAASTAKKKPTATRIASSKKGGPKRPATTWRNRQLTPTQERYREIQAALAARGYLNSEDATGAWNQSSQEALKKFQAEQNIASTGKINSLSLIALGLGPKRDPAPATPPAPAKSAIE